MQSSVRLSREMCAASKFYAYFLSIALYCVDNNEIKLMKKKNKRKEKRNKNLILYANGLHNVPFSSCSRRQTINTQTIITILFVFSRFFKQLKRRQGQWHSLSSLLESSAWKHLHCYFKMPICFLLLIARVVIQIVNYFDQKKYCNELLGCVNARKIHMSVSRSDYCTFSSLLTSLLLFFINLK